MVNKSFVTFLSVVILILFFITSCLTTTQRSVTAGSGIGGKRDGKPGVVDDGRRLNIGVEVFTVAPDIITPERRKFEKIDNSGVSNTGIQKQLNAGNSRTATQNSNKIEKRKIKVPTSTASKVLRDTESAYLAVRLKKLLEGTGKYGMVHNIPASKRKGNKVILSSKAYDYLIRIKILKSDGNRVRFRVQFHTSINWSKKPVTFKTKPYYFPKSAYVGKISTTSGKTMLDSDPYDVVLEKIISEFDKTVKANQQMYSIKRHQELTSARYGHFNAPEVYKDYPIKMDGKRGYVVNPAPDLANPFVSDVIIMHKQELTEIGKFESHYKDAAENVKEPYILWRKDTRKALITYENLKDEIEKVKKKVEKEAEEQKGEITTKRLEEYGKIGDIFLKRPTNWKRAITSLRNEALEDIKKSMIEKDGHITLPNFRTYLDNSDFAPIEKHANLLEGYNEQLAVQAVKVESLKEEFTTFSKPITLIVGTESETFYGKLDTAFRQYKEALRKEYIEKTGVAETDRDINNKSGKTASGGKETGGHTASSGSGREGAPETKQQETDQDTNDQLAQGQQQSGDTSGTGKIDNKPTDGLEQTTQEGQGSQGESQGTGGAGLASGQDKESDTKTADREGEAHVVIVGGKGSKAEVNSVKGQVAN